MPHYDPQRQQTKRLSRAHELLYMCLSTKRVLANHRLNQS